MTDRYPYKFNVTSLEYEDVASYLTRIPSHRWRIDTREMVGELTLAEWREVKACEVAQDAIRSGDDHRVVDPVERDALVSTDSDEKVEVNVYGAPGTATRRLLNRIAVQAGVGNAGICRNSWSAELRRGVEGYLVQFANKGDALLFKLAMWKRPEEDGR